MKLVSQLLGIIAFIFFFFSIQHKDKKKILGMQLVSNIFYTISYYLINAISATIIGLISGIRCLIYYQFEKKNKNIPIFVMCFLIIASCIAGLFTVSNIFDTLPIINSIIYIVTTKSKNLRIIQFGFIGAACIWIIYNLHVETYTPLIENIFEILSGTIAFIRTKNVNYNKKITLRKKVSFKSFFKTLHRGVK